MEPRPNLSPEIAGRETPTIRFHTSKMCHVQHTAILNSLTNTLRALRREFLCGEDGQALEGGGAPKEGLEVARDALGW